MKLKDLFETDPNAPVPETMYHVTLTARVDNIKKKGLLRMQTSNWVRAADGERYGAGEVYAFTHLSDALRWAAKMDYTFTRKIGSGEISVIEFKTNPGSKWDIDENDPLSQAGNKGAWVKSIYPVPADHIINAYPLTKEMVKSLTY